jgi:hypothetical protein
MTLTTLQQRIEALDCPYPGIVPFAEGFAVAKEFILKFVRDEIEKSTPTREEPERIVVGGIPVRFLETSSGWIILSDDCRQYLRSSCEWSVIDRRGDKTHLTFTAARAFARECAAKSG